MKSKRNAIDLSIVVPFYNEEDSVVELHRRLTGVLRRTRLRYEIIFVDDGSKDGTPRILEEIFRKDRAVHVIRLKKNSGQTAGLAAGFDFAEGETIISMDGDLQHAPEDIPLFLEKMREGYDVVSGWRKRRVDNFVLRRLPSLVANRMMKKLSGVDIHDFGTTFKAYRKEAIKSVALFGEMHRFIPALISRTGIKIVEIPIKNIVRPKGKSKYGLSRVRRVVFDLMTVKFMISFLDRPLQAFGLIGLLFGSVGFLIALVLTLGFYLLGWSIRENMGNLVLAVFLMILGVQFVMTGLLGEMISRIYFVTHKTKIYAVERIQTRRKVDRAADPR
jgi:glycosyltransferase involved in cell wall biosynthesis